MHYISTEWVITHATQHSDYQILKTECSLKLLIVFPHVFMPSYAPDMTFVVVNVRCVYVCACVRARVCMCEYQRNYYQAH